MTTADDVSSLDSTPAIGLREWASGARPVVGAIAASSLMLFACSWFAFSSGVLGAGRDVGRPDPVRIGGTTPQFVGGRSEPAAQPAAPGRVDVGGRQPTRAGVAASKPEVRQTSESGPEPEAAAATAPGPASTRIPTPSRATAPSDAPASAGPPPVVPENVTSNLPAPLDDLPAAPLPPVTPPVPVPDLSVPALSTVTTILGVP